MLKKLVATLCALFMLSGCAALQNLDLGAPELPPLCEEVEGDSWILSTAEKKQIPLNEVYYGFIDSVAMGMIVDVVDKQKFTDYMYELKDWYLENYPISYTTLIDKMLDMEDSHLMIGIVSRRVGSFRSELRISDKDDCIIREAWAGVMRDLWLK